MSVVGDVIEGWRAHGVTLNPGALPDALERLSAVLGLALPADLASFYAAADGMAEGVTAEWMTSFWPIDKILSERLEREGEDQRGPYRDLAFGDVMIDSWYLWLRIRPPQQLSFVVEERGEDHASFSAALERYVTWTKEWGW